MSELKTKPTRVSPQKYVAGLEREQARRDSRTLMKLLAEVTGHRPKMWGPSIIGYGQCHYRYDSGHEGDMPIIAFAPRGRELVLYLSKGFATFRRDLERLKPYRKTRVCVHLKTLEGVDTHLLKGILAKSVAEMRKKYPNT